MLTPEQKEAIKQHIRKRGGFENDAQQRSYHAGMHDIMHALGKSEEWNEIKQELWNEGTDV